MVTAVSESSCLEKLAKFKKSTQFLSPNLREMVKILFTMLFDERKHIRERAIKASLISIAQLLWIKST